MTITINGSNGLSPGGSSALPAFSAYISSASQVISSGAYNKVQAQAEEYDTANAYDNSTNYRFQPTVAGYYQINGIIAFSGSTALSQMFALIYKNGAAHKRGQNITNPSGVTGGNVTVSALIYLNGTTDYLELWGYAVGTGTVAFLGNTADVTSFSGCLLRAA